MSPRGLLSLEKAREKESVKLKIGLGKKSRPEGVRGFEKFVGNPSPRTKPTVCFCSWNVLRKLKMHSLDAIY